LSASRKAPRLVRRRRLTRALLMAMWLCSSLLPGQAARAGAGVWTPIGPPGGGSVFGFAIDPHQPQTLFASTSFGFFKSTDGGGSWGTSGLGSEAANLYTPAFGTDGALYAAGPQGPWRSTDGGATWQDLTPAGDFLTVDGFAFDPRDPRTIYLAALGRGVYKTTDGGATWNAVNQGLEPANPGASRANVLAIALAPRRSNVLLAATDQGIFRSANQGASWQRVTASCGTYALAFDPLRPARVYAGCFDSSTADRNGAMVSLDTGLTWQAASSGLNHQGIFALTVPPGVPRTVLAGTPVGVYRSTDAGAHWNPAGAVLNVSGAPAIIYSMASGPGPSPVVYAGTALAGAFRSNDLGAGWAPISQGLPAPPIDGLVSDPAGGGRLFASTQDGVLRTRNGGASWVPVDHGLSDLQIATLAAGASAPSTLYAFGFGGDLFVSTNAGRRWSKRQLPPELAKLQGGGLAVDPTQPGHVLLGASGAVFQSHDAAPVGTMMPCCPDPAPSISWWRRLPLPHRRRRRSTPEARPSRSRPSSRTRHGRAPTAEPHGPVSVCRTCAWTPWLSIPRTPRSPTPPAAACAGLPTAA
jgi:photosystem II stability/assembly factor-like uncharacterized protein